MQKNMAYMKPDPNLDLNTTEGRREQLRQLLGSRAQKNSDPRGDIEVLQPQFIEYTDDDELVVEIPVRPWQVNGIDQVQGGVLAYMIDCVFGPLSFVTSGYNPVGTMDMTTNYLMTDRPHGQRQNHYPRKNCHQQQTCYVCGGKAVQQAQESWR